MVKNLTVLTAGNFAAFEVQCHTVPHWRALMSDYKKLLSQGRGCTFKVCHAHLKNAILLSISLVGVVYFLSQLYIVIFEQFVETERFFQSSKIP